VRDFVFPSLHRFKDGYVVKLLTQHIRDSLTPSANKPIKESFSVKSCRKGAITQMAMHPDIGIFEACARSGHSTGTSQDSYIDKHSIASGMPGVRVLAGCPTAHSSVILFVFLKRFGIRT
jgi:hypothetical protein